jgi:hypothetical protein
MGSELTHSVKHSLYLLTAVFTSVSHRGAGGLFPDKQPPPAWGVHPHTPYLTQAATAVTTAHQLRKRGVEDG